MENDSQEEMIDSKFKIIEKIGTGGTANVFLVKGIDTTNIYAAKVLFDKNSKFYDKEIEILNFLKSSHNPNIANIIANGEGPIIRKDRPKSESKYFVLEYLPKGELIDYVSCPKKGFDELQSKFIFAEILNGVKSCHDMGVCHRDIKLDNILITDQYSPKLCDFGFATRNAPNLSEYIGTEDHAAPEIQLHQPYDGFRADIFSLGVVLINLTTSKQCFRHASKKDSNYKFIISNKLDRFWGRIDSQIQKVSKELKNLFIKMISFQPSDRPNIKEILESEWMKELNDMTQEQKDKLENDIKEEFKKREPIVDILKKQQMEFVNSQSQEMNNRGSDIENEYFEPNIKPKILKKGKILDNFIKLKGIIDPNTFMNYLCEKICKKFEDNCNVEPSKENLKFDLIFNEEIENEEEDEDEELKEEIGKVFEQLGINDNENIEEDENMKGRNTSIQIKLYETENKDWNYVLRFIKKNGNRMDYLDKVGIISNLIKMIN